MPVIQVRDVPEHIYRQLVEAAKRERRSLAQQVVATLAAGLGVELDAKARRRRLLQSLAGTGSDVVNRLPDPARVVREDRQR